MITSGLIAYIDPMSGVFLLQVFAAAFIGCLTFFRQAIWQFLRRIFGLNRSHEESRCVPEGALGTKDSR